MSIKLAVPETSVIHLKPRISVIGVGGGGGNAVNNMITQKLEGVDFIVANTDAQALANSSASRKIQLGLETTQGLGAGARPEVGRLAAEEAKEEIERELEGANMVFITAGMGGGTGSGAAPVVARLAKSKGILTVGVVTKPFQFEGKKRMDTADAAVDEFTSAVDSIIVIPNQNLFRVANEKTTLAAAFVMADNVLYAGVRSITDLMMMPGLINLDFADIKSIMEDKGKAIMGTGEAEGEDRAIAAAEQALNNPLLDNCSMQGAKGVLINITGGMDITLFEIDQAANRIKEEVDEDANIIFGSSFDESLNGKIRVSIVATGIDGNGVAKPKAPKITPSYIENNIIPEVIKTEVPSVETDMNLEKFSALKEKEEEIILENKVEEVSNILESAPIIPLTQENTSNETTIVAEIKQNETFIDYENEVENSDTLNDMPKSSSLFKAIINKTEDLAANSELNAILSSNENNFTPKNNVRIIEEEPELFPNHNPEIFAPRREEPEEKLIMSEEQEYRPTLIDKITGYSFAKRNRKKQKEIERPQEPISTGYGAAPDYQPEDRINLEIPSFLRRK